MHLLIWLVSSTTGYPLSNKHEGSSYQKKIDFLSKRLKLQMGMEGQLLKPHPTNLARVHIIQTYFQMEIEI